MNGSSRLGEAMDIGYRPEKRAMDYRRLGGRSEWIRNGLMGKEAGAGERKDGMGQSRIGDARKLTW